MRIIASFIFILLFVLSVMSADHLVAVPYQAGPFSVDVDVRNSIMLPIPDAKVKCVYFSETKIRLSASASGYVKQVKYIDIKPQQNFYKYDFVLADEPKKIVVCDTKLRKISSAYFNVDQYGFPAHQFGLNVFIPKPLLVAPKTTAFDVFDDLWGVPLKLGAKIKEIDGYHHLSMWVTRRALDFTGSTLYVVVALPGRDAEASDVAPWLQRLSHLEQQPSLMDGAAERLAAFIYRNFSSVEYATEGAAIPASLEALLEQQRHFAKLHREAL